ncbi:HalOD1 output domain-containing protein [Natrarchaeobaculum aegyptiacum]|uniref:Halobacterial output domain-containing protein n=1 Tax=Natrarchaeobaculum aegyptiacum TaxID=745377 RepID=A0A2Z2HU17_9EURY|nr:HalOD1 output domain-containing protein [Natrarchaeobaculum aegyptiacum]ARS90313.1 hypothetical protein B1756_11655 [Natrarchaeobaculum aegyptiacum]
MSGTAPTDRYTSIPDATGRTIYHDERRGTYHVWCDEGEYDPVSTAIVAAVAAIRDVEPETLEPFADSVDPDALNALHGHWTQRESESAAGTITFAYAGCSVTVRADGEVVVDPDPDSPDERSE